MPYITWNAALPLYHFIFLIEKSRKTNDDIIPSSKEQRNHLYHLTWIASFTALVIYLRK
jgi:hypothetical protein